MRPPEVRMAPSEDFVPAWKTTTPGMAPASVLEHDYVYYVFIDCLLCVYYLLLFVVCLGSGISGDPLRPQPASQLRGILEESAGRVLVRKRASRVGK